MYFLVTPKEIIVAKNCDKFDFIQWLMDRKDYESVVNAIGHGINSPQSPSNLPPTCLSETSGQHGHPSSHSPIIALLISWEVLVWACPCFVTVPRFSSFFCFSALAQSSLMEVQLFFRFLVFLVQGLPKTCFSHISVFVQFLPMVWLLTILFVVDYKSYDNVKGITKIGELYLTSLMVKDEYLCKNTEPKKVIQAWEKWILQFIKIDKLNVSHRKLLSSSPCARLC